MTEARAHALSTNSSVAILAAMVPELRPIVKRLGLSPIMIGDLRAHEGEVEGRRVVAAVTSIGTGAARAATTRVLDHGAVDHVVITGICGAIDPGLTIGALIVPTETMIEADGRTGRPVTLGSHQPAGRLLTTDTLHTDPATVAGLHAEGFVAVDMESGAIGAVCDDRGVAWSVFRAVSDRAGDPDVDLELLSMSTADGTPDPKAIARYLARHPHKVPKLATLGKGMRVAVAASTTATLAELAT